MDIGIGHTLKSCTVSIKEHPTQYQGQDLVLVDTPGFDDTNIPDSKILRKIANWLKKKSVYFLIYSEGH